MLGETNINDLLPKGDELVETVSQVREALAAHLGQDIAAAALISFLPNLDEAGYVVVPKSLLAAAREAGREEGRKECAAELRSFADSVLEWWLADSPSPTILGSLVGHARATAALWRE